MQILRYERVLYLDKEGQHLLAEDGLAGASLTKAIDDAVNAGLVRLNVLDGIVRVHLVEGEVSA